MRDLSSGEIATRQSSPHSEFYVQQIDIPKLFAGCLGLTGFSVAILAGLLADNTVESILTKAIVSMIACATLGMLLGMASEVALRDTVEPVDLATASKLSRTNTPLNHTPSETREAS
ncbi:MAG: hypothetical protein ACF8GE_05320 [Phycisphaerales bacterium JB043]